MSISRSTARFVIEEATPGFLLTVGKGLDFESVSPEFTTLEGCEWRVFAAHVYLCEFSLGEIQPQRLRETARQWKTFVASLN